MKHLHKSIFISIIALTTFACSQPEMEYSTEATLNSLVDSASYAVGFQNGFQLESLDFSDVNVDAYVAGFITAIESNESIISDDDLRPMFIRFNEYIRDRINTENKIKEENFLSENRTQEGVIETASGLQYKIVTPGEGENPTPQNTVVVMYEGRLIDGTIFDSTYGDGQPAEFILGQMIPGWIEGIQLMSPGAEFEFYIPADLAYGDNPRPGGPIKPGDTLIFKVELLEIK